MAYPTLIRPGSTIGILGGGQLAMMLAQAAVNLGYRVHVWCQSADEPAARCATKVFLGAWTDTKVLAEFLEGVQVVTYEFENVPYELAVAIEKFKPLRPSSEMLRITQDRWLEKKWLKSKGIATTPTTLIPTLEDVRRRRLIAVPSILKTCRFGYDGKGQVGINSLDELEDAWIHLGKVPCVLESVVTFSCEMSILTARNTLGHIEAFPAIENQHEDGILRISRAPGANLPLKSQKEGWRLGTTIARLLKLEGLFALETFVLSDGRVLVNEMAPRVHNSGHGTREACNVSQFEQHIRAICGLPLGKVVLLSAFEMENMIGSTEEDYFRCIAAPDTSVTWYGKKAPHPPNRKLGHIVRRGVSLKPSPLYRT